MPTVEMPLEDVVLFANEDVHEPDERCIAGRGRCWPTGDR